MTERSNSSSLLWNSVFSSTPIEFWLQVSLQAHQLTYDQLQFKSIALFFMQCLLTTYFSYTRPNKCKNALHYIPSWKWQAYLGTVLPRSEDEQVRCEGDKAACGWMTRSTVEKLQTWEGCCRLWKETSNLYQGRMVSQNSCFHLCIMWLHFLSFTIRRWWQWQFFSACFLSFWKGPNSSPDYWLPWSWEWQFELSG